MERRSLGKGINALIPEAQIGHKSGALNVQTGQIKPNPFQPRVEFDQESIEELAQSVKEKGVIQPLIVRQKGDYYELIAGERRLRAAQRLGLTEVPVVIKDVGDQDSLEIALIENVQREDLNAIEEAHAYKFLIEKYQLTQERIGEILGKARVSITNTLRLLSLPMEIQNEMKSGRLMFAHGRALLELTDENQQRRLAQEVISKSLSVRELENIIKRQRTRIKRNRVAAFVVDPYVAVMEEELQHALATKVRVVKRKKRGHIQIEFYSQEDLERIAGVIKGGQKT
ncbi:MAG: ParB/RepB/Spo0J family partition protein [Candidatus Omnitrophica bacterium]|nr:ParB/RepB/Spo0J family partition protein [Candidatus Omnitrophota bacterium]